MLLIGCAGDEINLDALDDNDRTIAIQAASDENVGVSLRDEPWIWTVEYGVPLNGLDGWTYSDKYGSRIVILKDITPCKNGGRDRMLYVVIRHEIGHAKGRKHSGDKNNIMSPLIPCWPESY